MRDIYCIIKRFGLAPMREGPDDGTSRCRLSITADGRSGGGARKKKHVLWAPPYNMFFLFPAPGRPSAIMDSPGYEGSSQAFGRWSQLGPIIKYQVADVIVQ